MRWLFLLSLSATIVSPCLAHAIPLVIEDPSFEELGSTLSDGGTGILTASTIPWSGDAKTTGLFNPAAGEFTVEVPDGDIVAFSSGGAITQQLSDLVEVNTRYTLRARVGARASGLFEGATVELLAGESAVRGTRLASVIPGEFAEVVVEYVTGGSDAAIGLALGIRLRGDGPVAHFDALRLDATPLPEPVSALLVALGVTLLAAGRSARS